MRLKMHEEIDALGSIQMNTDLASIGHEDHSPKEPLDNTINMPEETFESSSIYENIEALGFVFMLASNDIHTIHINASGINFQELHETADELYKQLNEYSDTALEIACEDGHFIHNLNNARDILNWNVRNIDNKKFTLKDDISVIIEILDDVATAIVELYDDVPSDIQSTFDEWLRYIDSKKNYFLMRVIKESKSRRTKKRTRRESIMLRNTWHDKPIMVEHLDYLQLGKAYKDFAQVEDHIEDYDCDIVTLKKGDYIIRDFQFGHLPNGGNKGYIPYKVIDIEYDRDEHASGYWDARKRLHVYDGYEDFYIEVYNERFNGMFHKLKKSSVKE